MKLITFLKENVWIISAIAAICALTGAYFSTKSWKQKIKENNQNSYNHTIISTFSDLFEPSKTGKIDLLELKTKQNLPEIHGFCFRVVDFKDKGNSFKGLLAKWRFCRLYKIAKIINDYTNNQGFSLGALAQPDKEYEIFFENNKENLEKLKKRFKKFMFTISDHL
jgi:hypothetical protein